MDDADWFRVATSSSATGRLVAAFDWASTSIGAPHCWPAGLRAACGICLTSRFPVLVVWGPDLRMIYNDGYREIIGAKHPAAIGAPVADVFPEVWAVIGPMFEQRPVGLGGHVGGGPAPAARSARVRRGVLLHVLLQPDPR